jgi:signal transduction histidine kinase/CheY-like chemotaxis protein
VAITVSPVRDRTGKIVGASKIARDITERRRFEHERDDLLSRERAARSDAEFASRVKDDFLAVLSHELRTPLHAIIGWARMLQSGVLDPNAMQRACDVIQRNAQAQSKLIEDLLDFGRINSGKLRLDVRPLYPIDIVKAAVDSVQPAANAKAIELHTDLDPRAGPISADPDRLQQVFWNLLMNAIKFTPNQGHVRVHLQRVASDVEFVVRDTGQGIAPEDLPYIFEMFRQGESGATRGTGGLGLGLALVRHLVELHGGSIEPYSLGRGQGSTFRITLPVFPHVGPPSAPISLPTTSLGSSSKITGVRVLLVEDDIDALEMQTHVLTAGGGDIRTARSVAEAMDILRGWRPHVIVADVEMPFEDGYTFVRRVRAEVKGHIPAIAMTAYSQSHTPERAAAAGFGAHIAKPFEPEHLLALVASVAEH